MGVIAIHRSKIKEIGYSGRIEELPELINYIKNGDVRQKKEAAFSIMLLACDYGYNCSDAVAHLFKLLDSIYPQDLREEAIIALDKLKEMNEFNRLQIKYLDVIVGRESGILKRKAESIIDFQEKNYIENKSEKELRHELLGRLKREYRFDGFHHYTDFSNFLKIMEDGRLLCREKARQNGFLDSANRGIINKTRTDIDLKRYVRFFYREKTPTTHNNEGIKKGAQGIHMPIPVLLLFKDEIMYHDNIALSDGGCGNKKTEIVDVIKKTKNFPWGKIFCKKEGPLCDEDLINRRNAEFLYHESISTKYLKEIIFRSPADMKQAIFFLGENSLYEVDKRKFHNHNNFLWDYKVKKGSSIVYFKPVFWRDSEDLEKSIEVLGENGRPLQTTYEWRRISRDGCSMEYAIDIPFLDEVRKIKYYIEGHLSAIWEDDCIDILF